MGNDDRILPKKRLVKRADGLRRNTVKFKAVIRCFIVVSGRWNDRPGVFVTITSHCFHSFSLSHIKSIKIVIFDNNNVIPDEQELHTLSSHRIQSSQQIQYVYVLDKISRDYPSVI
jgi:hypothetical protein